MLRLPHPPLPHSGAQPRSARAAPGWLTTVLLGGATPLGDSAMACLKHASCPRPFAPFTHHPAVWRRDAAGRQRDDVAEHARAAEADGERVGGAVGEAEECGAVAVGRVASQHLLQRRGDGGQVLAEGVAAGAAGVGFVCEFVNGAAFGRGSAAALPTHSTHARPRRLGSSGRSASDLLRDRPRRHSPSLHKPRRYAPWRRRTWISGPTSHPCSAASGSAPAGASEGPGPRG